MSGAEWLVLEPEDRQTEVPQYTSVWREGLSWFPVPKDRQSHKKRRDDPKD